MAEQLPDAPPGLRGQEPRPAAPQPVREALVRHPIDAAPRETAGGGPTEPIADGALQARAERAEGASPADAAQGARRFNVNGTTWHARVSGRAGSGNGMTARACYTAIHFYRAPGATHPEREVLAALPHGLDALYDEELAALLARSQTVPALEV